MASSDTAYRDFLISGTKMCHLPRLLEEAGIATKEQAEFLLYVMAQNGQQEIERMAMSDREETEGMNLLQRWWWRWRSD